MHARAWFASLLPAVLLLLLLLCLCLLPSPAWPAGMSTHAEVCTRAVNYFTGPLEAPYRQLLLENPEAYQAGAAFPDWGYSFGFPDASEDAHWPPFLESFVMGLLHHLPRPWDLESRRLVAFFLGIVSHDVADIDWHGLAGVQEGFIDVMSGQEFGGDWDAAHDCADAGGDFVEVHERDMSWLAASWYFPLDEVAALYQDLGYPDITAEVLKPRTLLLFLGALGNRLGGGIFYPDYAVRSTFLAEDLQDYLIGGLDSMALRTTWWWWDYIRLIGEIGQAADGPSQGLLANSSREGNPSNHDLFASTVQAGDGARPELLREAAQARAVAGGRRPEAMVQARALAGEARPAPMVRAGDAAAGGGSRRLVEGSVSREAVAQGLWWWQQGLIEIKEQATPRGVLLRARIDPALADASTGGRDPVLGQPGLAESDNGHQPPNGPSVSAADGVSGTARDGPANSRAPDLRLVANEPYAYLGRSLASGDFNRDGLVDLVLGTPGFGSPGSPQTGAVRICWGRYSAGAAGVEAEGIDFEIPGPEPYGRFGWSVAAGDFNADGFMDLAVGAPATGARQGSLTGRVYLFFGTGSGSGLPPEPDLMINGRLRTRLGWTLAAGDLNRDGCDDLVIGAPYAPRGGVQRGLAAVFYGGGSLVPGERLTHEDADWLASGAEDYDWFGFAVGIHDRLPRLNPPHPGSASTGAGGRPRSRMTNGDRPLLLVGAPGADAGALQVAGALYAYEGFQARGEEPLFVLEGDQGFAKLGAAFASGNFSGGPTSVLALSAPTRSDRGREQNGAVYVMNPEGLSGEMAIDEAAGGPAFTGTRDFSRLGWALSGGDENGDGIADLLVTEPWLDRIPSGLMSGAAFLWIGGPRFPIVPGAAVPASWVSFGPSRQARFGDAALIADLNGDGYGDLVLAASRDSGQARHGGSVSVYLGSAGPAGCFLATAAFGPEDQDKLRVLRAFRDRRLLSCGPGRVLVRAYYRFGPAVAEFLRDREPLRICVRVLLMPLVGLAALCT